MSKDLVFIVSGGRTGTQFFGDRLKDIIEDCWSEHEPDLVFGFSRITFKRIRRFGLWHMIFGRILGRRGVRVIGKKYLSGKLEEESVLDKIRIMRKHYHQTLNENLIIESYGMWWMLTPQIKKVWPDAKILCVIRDPRTWIESWLKYEPDRRNSVWKELVLRGNVTPEMMGDKNWAERWSNMSQVSKLAWEWNSIYNSLYQYSLVESSIKLVRFEDIFSDEEAMNEVLDFVSHHKDRTYQIKDNELANFTKNRINSSSGEGLSWQSWRREDALAVNEICGAMMKRFHYGEESEWLKILEE